MKKILLNHGWEFSLSSPDTQPDGFAPVDIPHDWLIYDAKDLYKNGDGHYRRIIKTDNPSLRHTLRFEGVYMDCDVFLNGSKIFEWKYGYTTFDVPLWGMRAGENLVEVLVRHRHPNSRWYSGAGIYRNIWLTVKGDSEILPDGTYVKTLELPDGSFETEIDTEVCGNGDAVLRQTVIDSNGRVCASAETELVLSKDVQNVTRTLPAFIPLLWSPETPNLYTLKTELIKDDITVDKVIERIGYKTIEFTTDKGLFLNGEHYKLLGTCIHHDMGALGSAVNKTAIRRQFEILKEMGVNSLRTSHNPPSIEFLDLCDEMGFLIQNECFDMWERPKNKYDYARFFPEWHAKDVRSWVRRDRNRACMLMWSIGNEISDTNFLPRGVEVTKELKRLVRLHDYKNLYPVTIGSNTMYTDGGQECAKYLDVVGYNYLERLYDEHHAKYPDWVIYGSETSSTYQSRGVYHFPAATVTSTYDDEQCSSLLNCATSYGAINSEYNITIDRVKEFSLGQYIWTALDYIGEPTPFHTKNSHFGHVDTAGFPKDTYYAYKAEWNSTSEPFVHLYPYWDFNEGQLIDLFIFSNCYESELWVNGECMGRHRHDHEGFGALSGRWQVPYHKGEIKAIGYDEDGNAVCETVRKSFGDAAKIVLEPDKLELIANGEDLIYVEISMADKDGNPVENDRSRVTVHVSGAGRLVGLDNGDSTDYDQYKGTSRRLFNGKLLAIIAAKDYAGDIKMTVSSVGLPDEMIIFTALPFDGEAACCTAENFESEPNDEIPVRRIDLRVSSQALTPDCRSITAEARLLPENTTLSPDDIMFKITNDAGVVTNLSKVEFKNGKAIVTAVGDGDYRLRAYCKNGTPFDAILSEIELKNEGFGTASFDPFDGMVSASLCSGSSVPLQVVMHGGLQALKEDCWIQFDNVDLGKMGTDELTVGIFSYSSEPIPFELCDGDGNVLEHFVYQAQSQWNTYKYNTFKLSHRYRGMMNLRFLFHESLRFEGFSFNKIPVLGSEIPASMRDSVFGDTFSETPEAIEHIGNNVTVVFKGLKLDGTAKKLIINGLTRNESESIRIVADTNDGQKVYTVVFQKNSKYTAQEFDIDLPEGLCDLTLLFLPGCDFDLKSISLHNNT